MKRAPVPAVVIILAVVVAVALMPLPDGDVFDPRRDLARICQNCRAIYERMALERVGVRPDERLVF
jgi:di/tricarboxylate transporter